MPHYRQMPERRVAADACTLWSDCVVRMSLTCIKFWQRCRRQRWAIRNRSVNFSVRN